MEFINQYLHKKKLIQEIILDYLDSENNQDSLQKIASYYENEKIREDKKEFLELIKMIETISEDHYHSTNFYQKIEQILSLFKNDIQQFFSNKEIFNIFKNNIRILLFLLNEKIVVLNKTIVNFIRSKYSVYFYPEIKEFESEAINKRKIGFVDEKNETNNSVDDIDYHLEHSNHKFDYDNGNGNLSSYNYFDSFKKEEIQNNDDIFGNDLETFMQKRLIGENDDILCQLIRNDNINDFISYINQNGININQKINLSDFETNSFLQKNHPTIIEYTAFFGSINIFKYLIVNKCELKPSIWLYSIHGMNSEIIHILEEKQIKPENNSYIGCFCESLKCHHTDFSNYLGENHIPNIEEMGQFIISICLKLNNYNAILYLFETNLLDIQFVNQIGFMNIFLNNDYIKLVEILLKQDEIDINQRTIIYTVNKNSKIKGYKSLIHIAFEKGYNELLKVILSNPKINVNQIAVSKFTIKDKINNLINRLNFFHIINDKKDKECYKEDTLLNMALTKGDLESVKLLLSNQSINPNIKTIVKKENETNENVALNIAIEKEYWDIARILLSIKEIDVNLKSTINRQVKTALSIAIEKNNMQFVKELISNSKINVNQPIKCSTYITSKHEKCYYHNLDEYDDYMGYDDSDDYENYNYNNQGPKKVDQEKNILYIAIENNDIDLVKLLLARQDINVNILTNQKIDMIFGEKNRETPLFLAVKIKNMEIIHMLLAHPKIDINKKSIICGSYCDRYGRINAIGGITKEKSPLYLAIEEGYIEIVKLLLNDKNININDKFSYKEKVEEEKTLLHLAIENMNIEIISLLLNQKDIDINAKKIYSIKSDFDHVAASQKTPLFMAAEIGSAKIVKLLLDRKDILINQKSIFTRKGTTKFVTYVVNYESDEDDFPVEKEDFLEEKTVLQVAIEKRNVEIVNILLSQPDIDVNEKIESRNNINDLEFRSTTQYKTSTTALHIAVINKDLEIIKLLLNHKKINVNAVDNQNKKPIDLTNNAAIKDLFKNIA